MNQGGGDVAAEARVPADIRRACIQEMQLYPLYLFRLKEMRAEIFEAGGDRSFDGMPGAGGGSIYNSRTAARMNKLISLDVTDLEAKIQRVEEVYDRLYPRQKEFFRCRYYNGYTIERCCQEMGLAPNTRGLLYTYERQIVRRMAARLGLM